jgi:hypothetical protein
MNDLVFVMCNLKLNDNQVKKQAEDFDVVLDDLPFDVDWIIEGEKHDGSSNFDLLGIIDSATRRKNGKEDESEEGEISNDVEMESHGIGDELEIQIDVNLGNSRSCELNNIDNIDVGTSSDTNNSLDDNDIDKCLRNNEEDEDNEASFSLHDIPTNYLFGV